MSVYEKINLIQAELARMGIGKTEISKQGYKYRGIDGAQQALAPLLAKYKLCIIPRVLNEETTERQKQGGGVLRFAIVKVQYDFVDVEQKVSDDWTKAGAIHSCVMVGEGFDSGDKAINKALSYAYKYMAWQTFCVPIEGVGIDGEVDDDSPEPDVSDGGRWKNQVRADLAELGLKMSHIKADHPHINSWEAAWENSATVLAWIESKRERAALDRAH